MDCCCWVSRATRLARSIYLSIYLPNYLSIYLSICLSNYLSVYPSVYLSIYLSISLRRRAGVIGDAAATVALALHAESLDQVQVES